MDGKGAARMVSPSRRSVNLRPAGPLAGPWAVFGLGSNLGDREASLALARDGLLEGGVGWVWASAVQETEPVGGPPGQGLFLNQLLAAPMASLRLSPPELLRLAKDLERRAGRVAGPRWGPRPLDIDLLLLGDQVIETADLTVPHPRLAERRFILEPLAAFIPQARHPVLGLSFAALLGRVDGGAGEWTRGGRPP